MPGLVPGIHEDQGVCRSSWMAGTSQDEPGHDNRGTRLSASKHWAPRWAVRSSRDRGRGGGSRADARELGRAYPPGEPEPATQRELNIGAGGRRRVEGTSPTPLLAREGLNLANAKPRPILHSDSQRTVLPSANAHPLL
jgi:hypothetical protein